MPRGKKKGPISDAAKLIEGLNEFVRIVTPLVDKIINPQAVGNPMQTQVSPTLINPYDVFAIKKTSSEQDFRQRYRELSKTFHPDKMSGSDTMIKLVNISWEKIKEEKGWI